ncbi:MAG: hypothetical protein AAF950_06840 [Pseudomonadota bacterium]
MDVLTSRSINAAIKSLLNALKGLNADQTLMLAVTDRDAPCPAIDQPRIKMATHHIDHRLLGNGVVLTLLREQRLAFEKAFDFHLRGKATRGITLERLAHDGGLWLLWHQHFAAAV